MPTHVPTQAQELQEAARRRLEEEQRAAAEAEAAAWEATRTQREVEALLARSAELRELKQKLQAAEVNLERSQQRDQRAAIEAREREYEAAMQAAMAAARQEAAAREAAEAEARRRLEQEARQALDAQLQERAELQRVARVGAQLGQSVRLWVQRQGVLGGSAAGMLLMAARSPVPRVIDSLPAPCLLPPSNRRSSRRSGRRWMLWLPASRKRSGRRRRRAPGSARWRRPTLPASWPSSRSCGRGGWRGLCIWGKSAPAAASAACSWLRPTTLQPSLVLMSFLGPTCFAIFIPCSAAANVSMFVSHCCCGTSPWCALPARPPSPDLRRQREAEAAEERTIQEYMRKRREREAAEATRQANKREAQDRCANVEALVVGRWGGMQWPFAITPRDLRKGVQAPAWCWLLASHCFLHSVLQNSHASTPSIPRAYELLKRQKEEEDARREEEEALLDLLRAEVSGVCAVGVTMCSVAPHDRRR